MRVTFALKFTREVQNSNVLRKARWPCPIAFEIHSALSKETRSLIFRALDQWETQTPWRFKPRTVEHDYIHFNPSEYCNAEIGYKFGRGGHFVGLSEYCTLRTIVHEIGHILGFWHEHTRRDRDDYVRILYRNIDPLFIDNFDIQLKGETNTPYDFYSIMHYRVDTSFAKRTGE